MEEQCCYDIYIYMRSLTLGESFSWIPLPARRIFSVENNTVDDINRFDRISIHRVLYSCTRTIGDTDEQYSFIRPTNSRFAIRIVLFSIIRFVVYIYIYGTLNESLKSESHLERKIKSIVYGYTCGNNCRRY